MQVIVQTVSKLVKAVDDLKEITGETVKMLDKHIAPSIYPTPFRNIEMPFPTESLLSPTDDHPFQMHSIQSSLLPIFQPSLLPIAQPSLPHHSTSFAVNCSATTAAHLPVALDAPC